MKKSGSIIRIVSVGLVVIGIIVSSFVTDYSNTISSVVTTITAVVGAVALYVQFKQDKKINQASFIVDFNDQFYENEQNNTMMEILDAKANGEKIDKIYEKKYGAYIISYLSWIKTLCSFLDRDVLSFDAVDEIYSYKFFVATNAKEIQDIELVPYAEYNRLIYKVHKKWTDYKKKNNLPILFEETSLSNVKDYDVYSK